MNILLISTKKDSASFNFYKTLVSKEFEFKEIEDTLWVLDKKNKIYLTLIEKETLYLEEKEIENKIEKIDRIIFLSKHATLSEIKPKIISAHAVGNWKENKFGGKKSTLVNTDAILLREILYNLKQNKPKNLKYEVTQEATHHGPFLNKPSIFLEIGSDTVSWNDTLALNYICKELIKVLADYNPKNFKKNNWKEAVGYGGSHYCTKFNKPTFDLENKYCFGHIIPDYAISQIKDKIELKKIIEEAKKKSNAKIVLDTSLSMVDF